MDRQTSKSSVLLKSVLILSLGLVLTLVLLWSANPLSRRSGEPRLVSQPTNKSNINLPTEPNPVNENKTLSPVTEIELVFTGDILIHLPILNQGLGMKTGDPNSEADFSWLFKHTSNILQEADLAVGNLEGTITGEPYAGYPVFRAPADLADNLQAAGFDYLMTINNHALDGGGINGVISTIEALRARDLDAIGTRASESDPTFLLIDCQGIQIALTAFSYETAEINGLRTLNGSVIAQNYEGLLDTFNIQPGLSHRHQADEAQLRQRARDMRAAGADIVIFLMHWGQEYVYQPDSWQKYYAQVLAEEGVNLIVGTHPHVVQPLELFEANNDQGYMACYYSLGNFVSNQQEVTGNTQGRAEEGAIARVLIQKTGEQAWLSLADYLPIYMYKTYPGYPQENKTYGWALPCAKALVQPDLYEAENLKGRLETAYKETVRIMGEPLKLPRP